MKLRPSMLVGVLALALVVGVGSAANASTPTKRDKHGVGLIRASADTTREEGSAEIEGAIELEVAGERVGFTLEGVTDLGGSGNGVFTMHADAALFGAPADIEMRFVDGILYMDFGEIIDLGGDDLPELLATHPWVTFDLSAAVEAGQAATPPGASSNPAGQLDALRGAAPGSVEKVGVAKVDGVRTTHYRAVIDLQQAIEEVPDEFRDELDQAFELFGDAFSDIPVDVWLDQHGRVRRQRASIELEIAGQTIEEVVTVDFTNFGVRVDVSAPPADETIGYEEFVELTSTVGPVA